MNCSSRRNMFTRIPVSGSGWVAGTKVVESCRPAVRYDVHTVVVILQAIEMESESELKWLRSPESGLRSPAFEPPIFPASEESAFSGALLAHCPVDVHQSQTHRPSSTNLLHYHRTYNGWAGN